MTTDGEVCGNILDTNLSGVVVTYTHRHVPCLESWIAVTLPHCSCAYHVGCENQSKGRIDGKGNRNETITLCKQLYKPICPTTDCYSIW